MKKVGLTVQELAEIKEAAEQGYNIFPDTVLSLVAEVKRIQRQLDKQKKISGIYCARHALLLDDALKLKKAAQVILKGYDNPNRDGEFDWPTAAENLRTAIKSIIVNRIQFTENKRRKK